MLYPLIAFACVAIFAAGFMFGVWDRRQFRSMRGEILKRAAQHVADCYRELLRQLLGSTGIANVPTTPLRDALDSMQRALKALDAEVKDYQ